MKRKIIIHLMLGFGFAAVVDCFMIANIPAWLIFIMLAPVLVTGVYIVNQ